MSAQLYCGDALEVLGALEPGSVRCCVTSPPYWGRRDYGVSGQMGLEATPDEYVLRMVKVFGVVRELLTNDGTLWLNVGDSYAGSWGAQSREHAGKHAPNISALSANQVKAAQIRESGTGSLARTPGLKPKDLIGIPWRLAFALQADGWWLRSDIIWAKPNPMPESVTDRPTKAHEYVFLLSKSERYYYDATAIAERTIWAQEDPRQHDPDYVAPRTDRGFPGSASKSCGILKARRNELGELSRNARTVWEIATQPYAQAHFATFPEELARRCILAGSASGDTVLDPFGGSGTVAQVATGNGRSSIHVDLNPKYVELARQRIGPLLCSETLSVGSP